MKEEHNPWLKISPRDYEKHMSNTSVGQLQKLNLITKNQYQDYLPEKLIIFGVSTGNGLEHIINSNTTSIYGIDINQKYLNICNNRYSDILSGLELYNIDINRGFFKKDQVDLIIANLFLEYVSIERMFQQIELIEKETTVISFVFQQNNENTFVSETGIKSLNALSSIHKDIKIETLIDYITLREYQIIKESIELMPNNKELVRIDIQKDRSSLGK